MTKPSSRIQAWTIPRDALDVSFCEMAADGLRGREGIALWAGVRSSVDSRGVSVRVTHVLLLRGTGVDRSRGFIRIAPSLLNEVTDALTEVGGGAYLVGQIHGHPPECSVDLSPTDKAYGISTQQYLSVVAPDFGCRRDTDLSWCGVHVFERPLWRRLGIEEARRRLVISADRSSVVTVGGESAVDTPCTTDGGINVRG